MTSYLPVRIDDEGDYVPVKFGGYNGYKEITITKGDLIREFGKDYESNPNVISYLIRNEGVADVKEANRCWVDKEYFSKLKKYIKKKGGYLIVNIDGKDYKVKVKEITNWSRGSGQIMIDGSIFNKFSDDELYNAIVDAVKMKFGITNLNQLTRTEIRKLIGHRAS